MQLAVNVKLALSSIRGAKLRSFLTSFAVIIGVTAFVIVTTTVEGLKASVTEQINSLGGNLVTINSGKIAERNEEGEITGLNFAQTFGIATLTEQDLNDLSQVEGVDAIAPQVSVIGTVSRGDEELSGGFVIASNADYPEAFGQTVAEGEFFADDETRNFTVIGQGVVDDLFGGEVILGSTIQVRGQDFTIVGVMEESELNFGFGPDLDKVVIIPLEFARQFSGGTLLIQEIDAQVDPDANVDDIVSQMEAILLENHGGEEDFTVLKQDELIDVTNGILDILKQASQFIAYIMLFVGAIVILLIMLITVRERTREIGVRKSIGATSGNIRVQFITEAIVLSLFGSLIGILVGWLLGFLVRATIDITPQYSLNTLIAVVVISIVIGALGGFYPANRAAKLDPVEALRHE